MALDWRKLLRDKRAWAVGGIGGAIGIGLYLRSRSSQPASPTTGLNTGEAGPAVSMAPSVYDSSLQDIAEGFQQTALDLQTQIAEIQAQLDAGTPASPTTPPAAAGSVWRGTKVTKGQTLFGFAQEHGGTLPEIIAHNPWLRGKTGSYRVRPGQIIVVRPLRNQPA